MTTTTLADKNNLKNTLLTATKPNDTLESHCEDHSIRILAMRDAMDVLGGKWRLPIVGILNFKGKMRFTDILRAVHGIGAKMLSKELQDLEANQLLTRTVKQTKPITVEYEITDYGRTLLTLINEIVTWGIAHREKIMKSDEKIVKSE
ncbi:MAG TPA: helix-turn-helix domain-containing protein [Cyclobacteriaceae bacterium]